MLKLQDESIAFGPGAIFVDDGGELVLCGSRASVGIGNNVEIQDGGELRIVWFSAKAEPVLLLNQAQTHSTTANHCAPLGTFSSSTTISSANFDNQPLPIIDPVFGIPLSLSEASIFVPSTIGQSTVLSLAEHSAVVDSVARQFAQLGGGATTVPAFGMWISEGNGQLVRERVTIVTVAVDIQREDVKQTVRQIARDLAEKLNQEAVFVKLNNVAYLVRQ